jgi:hypothetical protein
MIDLDVVQAADDAAEERYERAIARRDDQERDEALADMIEMAGHVPALIAELRAAQKCVDRVRAHVLNDQVYCARCMEDLVAYEKVAGLPVTTPEATRTHTGEVAE